MKLNVREWGESPQSGSQPERLAILVHGFTGSAGDWVRLAPRLVERGYRVLAVDQRGHGESPRADDYSVGLLVEDLLETVPTGADVVMGHSLGGIVVAHAAERLAPKRIVYLDPAWAAPPPDPDAPPAPDPKARTAESVRALNPTWADEDVEASVRGAQLWDEASGDYLRPLWTDPALALGAPPFSTPALVVAAGEGRLVPPEMQQKLAAEGYVVRVMPNAGHSLHRDDLDGLLRIVDDFI